MVATFGMDLIPVVPSSDPAEYPTKRPLRKKAAKEFHSTVESTVQFPAMLMNPVCGRPNKVSMSLMATEEDCPKMAAPSPRL